MGAFSMNPTSIRVNRLTNEDNDGPDAVGPRDLILTHAALESEVEKFLEEESWNEIQDIARTFDDEDKFEKDKMLGQVKDFSGAIDQLEEQASRLNEELDLAANEAEDAEKEKLAEEVSKVVLEEEAKAEREVEEFSAATVSAVERLRRENEILRKCLGRTAGGTGTGRPAVSGAGVSFQEYVSAVKAAGGGGGSGVAFGVTSGAGVASKR
eukprot:tig00021742_g23313.t1